MTRIALVTPSYAPDFERCRLLCASVQRLVEGFSEHVIIVDRQDEALFRPLCTERTRLLVKENILPSWLRRLPFTRRWWLNLRGLPVRGWILQQIVKLSVAEAIEADVYVFVDSDMAFVRPFDVHRFIDAEGRVRLFAGPRKETDRHEPRHVAWYRHAQKIVQPQGGAWLDQEYISQMVTWRRDTLERLTQHISATHGGRPWQAVLANTLDFSEYVLYGIYAAHGPDGQSGHYLSAHEPCHCSWHHQISDRDSLLQFLQQVSQDCSAVLIQSNLGIAPQDYAEALEQLQRSN